MTSPALEQPPLPSWMPKEKNYQGNAIEALKVTWVPIEVPILTWAPIEPPILTWAPMATKTRTASAAFSSAAEWSKVQPICGCRLFDARM